MTRQEKNSRTGNPVSKNCPPCKEPDWKDDRSGELPSSNAFRCEAWQIVRNILYVSHGSRCANSRIARSPTRRLVLIGIPQLNLTDFDSKKVDEQHAKTT